MDSEFGEVLGLYYGGHITRREDGTIIYVPSANSPLTREKLREVLNYMDTKTMPEPPKEEWEVQRMFLSKGTWERSWNEGLKGTFPTKEAAQKAMDTFAGGAHDYRLYRIDTKTAETSLKEQQKGKYIIEYLSASNAWVKSMDFPWEYTKEQAEGFIAMRKSWTNTPYRMTKI